MLWKKLNELLSQPNNTLRQSKLPTLVSLASQMLLAPDIPSPYQDGNHGATLVPGVACTNLSALPAWVIQICNPPANRITPSGQRCAPLLIHTTASASAAPPALTAALNLPAFSPAVPVGSGE